MPAWALPWASLLLPIGGVAWALQDSGDPQASATARGQGDAAEEALPETSPEITAADIRLHVERLASDAFEGRYARGAGGQRAADDLERWFAHLGLEPMGEPALDEVPVSQRAQGPSGAPVARSYRQFIDGDGDDGEPISPNLLGALPGEQPGWLLLTAHYDHLEPLPEDSETADRIFNGADDNASGTAAVLELAEAFAARGPEGRPSLLFIAFTAEEGGLAGSFYFVSHPTVPLSEVRGVINLDMVSRGEVNLIFCETNEPGAGLGRALTAANRDVGLDLRFGQHPEWLAQSDQYPFHLQGLPVAYLGVEDHPDYHRVSDHADRILPELTRRVASLVMGAVLALEPERAPDGAR